MRQMWSSIACLAIAFVVLTAACGTRSVPGDPGVSGAGPTPRHEGPVGNLSSADTYFYQTAQSQVADTTVVTTDSVTVSQLLILCPSGTQATDSATVNSVTRLIMPDKAHTTWGKIKVLAMGW